MRWLIPRLNVVEALVLIVIALFLGSLVFDQAREIIGKQNGTADAIRDTTAGQFSFRVSGRQRPWFSETAAVFRQRYGAELVRSHGCCPSCYDSNYDLAYNDQVAATLSLRIEGFTFYDAYNDADEEARTRVEEQFLPQ